MKKYKLKNPDENLNGNSFNIEECFNSREMYVVAAQLNFPIPEYSWDILA